MVTHDETMPPQCDRILTIENKKVVSREVPEEATIL